MLRFPQRSEKDSRYPVGARWPYLTLVILGCLGLVLWLAPAPGVRSRQGASDSARPVGHVGGAPASAAPQPGGPFESAAAKQPAPEDSSDVEQNVDEAVRLLLETAPGTGTSGRLRGWRDYLVAHRDATLARAARLTASSQVAERMLGYYLQLEIDGPSESILGASAADSLSIRQEVANWLWRSRHFEAWQSYTSQVLPAIAEEELRRLMRIRVHLSEAIEWPASFRTFGIGAVDPGFLIAAMRTAPAALALAGEVIESQAVASAAKTRMVDLLVQAWPAGVDSALARWAGSAEVAPQVRNHIVLGLAPRSDSPETVRALRARAEQVAATDAAGGRWLLAAVMAADERLRSGQSAQERLAQAVTRRTPDSPPSARDAEAMEALVRQAEREGRKGGDPEAWARVRVWLDSIAAPDEQVVNLQATFSYLDWLEARSAPKP